MKILSLFSAPGGLDLGMKNAGHKIVWANDIDEDAVETYRNNIGSHIVSGDIKTISVKDMPDANIVMGGFPCLGFTVANLVRRKDDPRNLLYLELVRVLKEKQPEVLLAENVPGILSLADGQAIKAIMNDFSDAGYNVKYRVLFAPDYGVPQKRKRVIFLGMRKDIDIDLKYPLQTHHKSTIMTADKGKLYKWMTLRDAIGNLPEPNGKIPNHEIGTNHKVKITGYLGNRILKWDEPSPTIMGRGSRTGGAVIPPHPNLKRRLTVRECARIQTFPDNFIFFGSPSAQFAQVGNAVPPLLAQEIGDCLPKKI